MTTSHEKDMILISGASTGMGLAASRELASRGYFVLAGVRNAADATRIRAHNLEPVILDVTEPEHIEAVAARIANDSAGRKLTVLINNAGIAVNAPVETLPLDAWRRQFEVNLFGHIAVTQAMLPFLHDTHGRIVNVSSIGGRVSMGTYGAYAGAKFALEAVSDSLRRELAPHGVSVVVIQPGGVATEMTNHGIDRALHHVEGLPVDQRQRYGSLIQAIINQATAFTASGLTADEAALVFARAATSKRPRTRYTIGRDAAMLTRLARVLPDRVLDRVLEANLRPHMPKVGAQA